MDAKSAYIQMGTACRMYIVNCAERKGGTIAFMAAITIENQLQRKTQTADRLCYLFIIFLAGCLVFAADCILSALFRTPITY